MNHNIIKRIEIIEKKIDGGTIPDKERIIVICYPNGDEAEFTRLYQLRLAELKNKYGNISEDELLVIGVRKFAPLSNNS